MRNSAFTLAEVLITLAIIGVVAAMTIPTLMNNIADAQFKSAMKKNYSIMNGLSQKILADDGGDFSNALLSCTDSDHTCFKNALKPYFSYIKECDGGSSLGVCFPSSAQFLNKTTADSSFRNAPASGLVLKDGTMAIFYLDSASCNYTRNTIPGECGWVTIDVNGLKQPNTWGKDIYTFLFYKNAVRPLGTAGDGNENTCSTSSYGLSCAASYLLN